METEPETIKETTEDVVPIELIPSEEEIKKEEEIKEKKPVESVAHQKPAPVLGETERERGLRFELERLRGKLRKESTKDIVENVVLTIPKIDPYKDLRDKGYSEEEIMNMESAVDSIAKNKGYIRAEDSYKQSVQDTVDMFVDQHPEYQPINDKNDLRWTMFQEILQSGIYSIAGKNPRQLKTIFAKVDEDVKKELNESIPINTKQIKAQQYTVNVASHSGGTRVTNSKESKINPNQPIGGIHFKGFSEEDFE